MIIVNCVWKRDNIINAVENIKVNEKNVFKYIRRNGIRLFFENSIEDLEAVNLIKKAIKEIPGSEALVTNVVPYINNNCFDGYTKLLYKEKKN